VPFENELVPLNGRFLVVESSVLLLCELLSLSLSKLIDSKANKLIKLYQNSTFIFVIDVLAMAVAFLGMVLMTSICRQMSR